MNKPTLNILGRKHNIVSVEVEMEPGETEYFYDGDYHEFLPEDVKVDFSQAIENPSNAQKFIERLKQSIKESRDYLIELKLQIADTYLQDIELPFPQIEFKPIVEKIKGQALFIEGLEHALDIATGKVNIEIEVPSTDA
ncbi:MAG TPA: hypothetical protein VNQ57_11955 [Ureibacillus sp.]|nr:hypothetical protein [Ureibacillus sp.]